MSGSGSNIHTSAEGFWVKHLNVAKQAQVLTEIINLHLFLQPLLHFSGLLLKGHDYAAGAASLHCHMCCWGGKLVKRFEIFWGSKGGSVDTVCCNSGKPVRLRAWEEGRLCHAQT